MILRAGDSQQQQGSWVNTISEYVILPGSWFNIPNTIGSTSRGNIRIIVNVVISNATRQLAVYHTIHTIHIIHIIFTWNTMKHGMVWID
jgi:hypothetical protein